MSAAISESGLCGTQEDVSVRYMLVGPREFDFEDMNRDTEGSNLE